MKLSLLCLACALTLPAIAAAQPGSHPVPPPPPIHNGVWWQDKSGSFREGFVYGYKSGNAHAIGHKTEVNQFPSSELIEGMDKFYKDFRNRNILVDDALVYVTEQLSGVADDKLKTEVLKMRAASVPANVE